MNKQQPQTSLEQVAQSGQAAANALAYLQAVDQTSGKVPAAGDANCTVYQKFRSALAHMLQTVMDENKLDALVYPSANQGPPALTALNPPPNGLWLFNILSAVSGLPALVMPLGLVPPSNTTAWCCRAPGTWRPQAGWWAAGSKDHVACEVDCPQGPADGSASPLPVGLTALGRANSEDVLISLATAYEQAFPQRRPPPIQ
mgnify:CR=1 FL=1